MVINAEDKKTLVLNGFVAPGRGVGTCIVTANRDVIGKILGAEPYPGTLNVALSAPAILKRARQLDKKGKLFGVPGAINGTPCLIYRFHQAPLHIVEIVAAVQLRNALGLQDGQAVKISLPQENIAAPASWRHRLWELFYGSRLAAYYDEPMHEIFMSCGVKFVHKKICQSKREFV